MDPLEQIQRRAKMIRGLRQRLRALGLFSLKKKRLWEEPIAVLSTRKAPSRTLKREFLQEHRVTEQVGMALNGKGVD